jgi:hypothetical protein
MLMEKTNMSVRLVHIGAIIIALFPFFNGEIKGQCPQFLSGSQVGIINNRSLDEISGIAASRKNVDVFWAHNDSGAHAQVWAFNTQGAHLGTYNLANANNNDWEDMAIGPGPNPNKDYLYISDIGNNDGLTNHTYSIYRVPEPNVSAGQKPVNVELNNVDTFPVKYPDSLRHDCETMMVDVNGDIYLCTRDRWNDDHGIMKIYRYPAPHTRDVVYTLQHAANVQLIESSKSKGSNWEMTVGGDISLNGSLVIIRTKPKRYDKGVPQRILLWQRRPGTNLWDAFDNPMCVVPSLWEPQGEAICFDANGCGYYTISEGRSQPIYYFACYGQYSAGPGDLDVAQAGGDGIINMNDLALLVDNWFWGK